MSTSISKLDGKLDGKRYHHGDLRAALVEAGLTLLAARDADDLSLRGLARTVGVSATAVYRHFPDKGALMAALAAEGLRQLALAQHAASDAAGGGLAGFNATGQAYVRFALANPALFRLIFAHPPRPVTTDAQRGDAPECEPPHGEAPDFRAQAGARTDAAMALLLDNAAALAPPGVPPQVFALHAWSVAHGLAMLMLDGQVPVDDATIDAVVDAGLWTDGPVAARPGA